LRRLRCLLDSSLPAALHLSIVETHAYGHGVQPTRQRHAAAQRVRSPRKDQKDGLKSVFGVRAVGQHARTDPRDERPTALDQFGEGSLVTRACETANELAVGFVV
jgi:hypothetical protein